MLNINNIKTKLLKQTARFVVILQIVELSLIFIVSAPIILMFAFSGASDLEFALGILWKAFIIKTFLLFFLIKKNKYAVILNIFQNVAIVLFSLYSVYYTIIYGEKDNIQAFLAIILILVGICVFYATTVKILFNFYKKLSNKH